MLKELANPNRNILLKSNLFNSKLKSPNKDNGKLNYENKLSDEKISTLMTSEKKNQYEKSINNLFIYDTPKNPIIQSIKQTNNKIFGNMTSSLNVNNQKIDETLIKNENQTKEKKKQFLLKNINVLKQKVSHYNNQIENFKKCNEKTADENLKIGFAQDDIIHDRIHMEGQIPRMRVRINDMREEIKKLEKETKQYEILAYQFIQEKVLMEQDVKKYDKDVKNLALNTNALHYQVKQFKNKIKEIKIILEQKKKETGFLKDVTNLINIV
jgi:hypothetical protein